MRSNATVLSKAGFPRRLVRGPLLWLLPLLVVLFCFYLYPVIDVVRYSFTDAKMTSNEYVYTFRSYINVFTSQAFYQSLRRTFIFVSISVVFQFLLGFAIAYAVDHGERGRAKGTLVTRTIALISWAIPGVVIGVIWKIMLEESPSGIFNYGLSLFGVSMVDFLSNPNHAIISVSVANVWRGTAQSMILLYAGLKTVSRDVIEAGYIDGANMWSRLWHIILPSMRSVITVNILLNIINTFNTFDMVMSLTGGGPGRSTEVLVLGVYNRIFSMYNLGQGSAMAVILLFINIIMSLFYIRFVARGE
ncbi:MAG: sugar ABC transporter permease [Treponema sp.]|jgi:multiple sugar transport system permease protein|nr:sugar ABC transporter permease [Treponema sp.]